MRVESFDAGRHLAAVVAMCAAEGWPNWSEPEPVARALAAPGVIALVAVDGEDVAGFAQVLTDGVATSYLSLLVTAAGHRRRGVARALVDEAFDRCGTRRMDLLADPDAHGFYRSLPHRTLPGFRIFSGYRGGHITD